MTGRRIAITGLGCVSALGATRDATWRGLIDGRCGIDRVTVFDPTGYRSERAAELADYDAAAHFTPLERRRWSRSDQIAVLASAEALEDAGLDDAAVDPDRVGVMLGAGTSDLEAQRGVLRRGPRARTRAGAADEHLQLLLQHARGRRRRALRLRGPSAMRRRGLLVEHDRHWTWRGGHSSGGDRRRDRGASDVLCRLTFSGFNALRLVDPSPCRPFCRSARRHEHRRGGGDARARGSRARARRGATSTRKSRG